VSRLRLPYGQRRSLSQRTATSLIAALRDTPSTTAWPQCGSYRWAIYPSINSRERSSSS
jgi:hypothetical protein